MDEEEFILKMCETKERLKNKERAERRLRIIKKTGRIVSSNFRPYKCPYCNGWHLGHTKG